MREGAADLRLRRRIHGGCGVVQNQDLRFFQQRPGNTQPLFLSAGQVVSALVQLRIIAILKGRDKLVCLGGCCGTDHFLVCRILVAPAQVLGNRTGEQHVLLQHHTHAFAQVIQAVILHVHAVYQDFAFVRVIQPRNHAHQRALTASGRPDNADNASRLDGQADVIQHAVFAVLVIAERNVTELHPAFFYGQFLLLCVVIVQVRFLFQHLTDTFGARHRPGGHHEQERHHNQGGQDLDHIVHKRGQITYCHFPAQHQGMPLPCHCNHRHIHDQRCHRLHLDHNTHCAHCGILQVSVGLVEFPDLIRFPYKGLYHAHIGDVFLHRGVQAIHLCLDIFKSRESGQDIASNKHQQHRNADQKDHRQIGPQADRHNQSADHHARSPQCHSHEHGHEILHLGHVVGHPCHKRAGGKPVNIAE